MGHLARRELSGMSSAIPSSAAPNSTTLRDLLRLDLKDPASAANWSDAELDRHIAHAIEEYSLAFPYKRTTQLTATAGVRTLSLATLTHPISIEAVEWPTGNYPRTMVDFYYDQVNGTLTLLGDSAPASTTLAVNVTYDSLHTVSASQLTVPEYHYALVLQGAAAYAAEEWASYATNRVNLDARAVGHYLEQARRKLSHFHGELQRPRRTGALQQLQTYTPNATSANRQNTDPGP